MCVQDCRTFLWGGAGISIITDSPSSCSCACEDGSWAQHNILGSDSCVPVKAHLVFGSIGVFLAVAGLFHAVYQLRRQLKSHAGHMVASVAPVERCRKQMHITAIFNAFLSIFYFSSVLLVEDSWLQASAVVMFVIQITTILCGFLTVRMWIYTNDPRLMRGSATVIAISTFLEGKTGERVSYVACSVTPVIGAMLTAFGHEKAAIRVVGVAFIFLVVFADTVFFIYGRSLLVAIGGSLLRTSRRISLEDSVWAASMRTTTRTSARTSIRTGPGGAQEEEGGRPVPPAGESGTGERDRGLRRKGSSLSLDAGEGERGKRRKGSSLSLGGGEREPGQGRRGSSSLSSSLAAGAKPDGAAERGRDRLLAARKKVRWAMVFCAQMSLQAYALLIFSVCTEYGTAAPLVLFGIQMTILPLIWHVVHIELHAGRSTPGTRGRGGGRGVAAQQVIRLKDDTGLAAGREGGAPQGGRKKSLLADAALGRRVQVVAPTETDGHADGTAAPPAPATAAARSDANAAMNTNTPLLIAAP